MGYYRYFYIKIKFFLYVKYIKHNNQMEFLVTNKKFLEIYNKDTNPTNTTDFNENSELVEIVESILNDNQELLSKDLDYFIEQIDLLKEEYKNKLNTLGLEKNIQADLNELFNLIDSKKFYDISGYVKKNEFDEELTEYVRRLFSVSSIQIYIKGNIEETSNKLISEFDLV